MEDYEFRDYSEYFPLNEKIKGRKKHGAIKMTKALFSSALVVSVAAAISFSAVIVPAITPVTPTPPPVIPVTPVNPDPGNENPPEPDKEIVPPTIQNELASYNYDDNTLTIKFDITLNDATSIVKATVTVDDESNPASIEDTTVTATIDKELADGDYTANILVEYTTEKGSDILSSSVDFTIKNTETVTPTTPSAPSTPQTVAKQYVAPTISNASANYYNEDMFIEGQFTINKKDASSITSAFILVDRFGEIMEVPCDISGSTATFEFELEIVDETKLTAQVNYVMNGKNGKTTANVPYSLVVYELLPPEITNITANYDAVNNVLICDYDIVVNDAETIISATINQTDVPAAITLEGSIDPTYHVHFANERIELYPDSQLTTTVRFSIDGYDDEITVTVPFEYINNIVEPTLTITNANYADGLLEVAMRITENDAESIDSITVRTPWNADYQTFQLDPISDYYPDTGLYKLTAEYNSEALQANKSVVVTVGYTISGENKQLTDNATIAVTEDYPITFNITNFDIGFVDTDAGGTKLNVQFNGVLDNVTVTNIALNYTGTEGDAGTISIPVNSLIIDSTGNADYQFITIEEGFNNPSYTVQLRFEYTDYYGNPLVYTTNAKTFTQP